MLEKMKKEFFEIIEEKCLDVKRFFRNVKYGIKNIIKYTPLIVQIRPWDYQYGLDLFVTFLEDLAEYNRKYESQYYISDNEWGYVHEQIDEWIKLYRIVYNETEPNWQELLIEKFGNRRIVWRLDDESSSEIFTIQWENNYSPEELEEIKKKQSRLIRFCLERDKENFNKLWDNFKNNHRNWWN